MSRFSWASLLIIGVVGCSGGEKDAVDPTDADTDADSDTDADTDSDTDSDADSDTDADTDTPAETADTAAPPPATRTGATNGQGVALTADGTIAVVANRTAGEITVLDMNLAAAPATGGIRVTYNEGDNEPFAAVISNDDDTAFVVLRNSGEVVRIDDLHGAATLYGVRAATNAEPSGIAISPNGSRVYVTSWAAGTVSVIDTATMAVHEVDLNQSLVDSGSLGTNATARTGLARPYAIVVTNDGDADDDDETVLATEFFGQDIPGAAFAGDLAFFDTNKQGLVYRFDTGTETPDAPIPIAPIDDTGLLDANGAVTGCSPNQLYAAALDGDRLYVTAMCASPRGPQAPGAVDKVSNFKTKVQPTLFVIDVATGVELEDERLVLNAEWQGAYVAAGFADDSTRRYPLIPNSLAFVPGTHIAYLTAYGTDAVFRIELDGAGGVSQIGSGINKFINLAGTSNIGKLPYGIALTSTGNALVVNESTRNLSIVDLGLQAVEAVVPSATPVNLADPDAVAIEDGRRFFVTGMGRWSFAGQGWGSCEGCHPHGLTDNVTWFFAAGPRQSTSLDGSFGPNGEHRIFNWTAIFDEVADFEGNTRGISGGVGALVYDATTPISTDDRIVIDGTTITGGQLATDTLQAGLNGSTFDVVNLGVPAHDVALTPTTADSVLEDWNSIDSYIRTIRAPNAPELDAALVAQGAALFTANGCQGCHGGENWTISERFYTPSQLQNDATTGLLGTTTYSRGTLPAGLNPPSDTTGTAFFRAGGSIQCVLRAVGTYPASGTTGIAPVGVSVLEVKEDMVTAAAGLTGFNPPSLIGVGAGAPYMHAGNARTLEEVFDPTFKSHYRAFSANFTPSAADIEALVAYLQSVDDAAPTVSDTLLGVDNILCE